jgi:hypothetical protein
LEWERERLVMTDPTDGLKSFQQEIRRGTLKVQRAKSDSDLFVHLDTPLGALRYTYVRLTGKTVTALVMFAMVEPIEGRPCFGVGYAVPKAYRNQGRAKEVAPELGRLSRLAPPISFLPGCHSGGGACLLVQSENLRIFLPL